MLSEPVYRGHWQQLVAVRKALCSDGKRRYVRITSEPDTFFSVPGSVKVKGRTVSGFVTCDDGDYKFHASQKGKNGGLLP